MPEAGGINDEPIGGAESPAMIAWMKRIIESKRAMRRELAALPFAEKMKIVRQLQEAAKLLKSMKLEKTTRS